MKFPRTLKSLLAMGIVTCLVIVGVLIFSHRVLATHLRAEAQISGPDIIGTLFLTQTKDGFVRIRGTIQGQPTTLTPGRHGFHIHSVGVCEPGAQPAFSSSGGHYDPGPFGSETPVEANHPYHTGDLPNLVVDDQGTATYDNVTSRATLSDSPVTVFDSNGSAIIIHQLPDQVKAQGTAADAGGGRIACGVITKS